MSFIFLQLAARSRDLSQALESVMLCKAEQIHKMNTIFIQKDNFLHPVPSLVIILWICSDLKKSAIHISQLDINHVIQQPTEEKQRTPYIDHLR